MAPASFRSGAMSDTGVYDLHFPARKDLVRTVKFRIETQNYEGNEQLDTIFGCDFINLAIFAGGMFKEGRF
jgi:hypothetical protein